MRTLWIILLLLLPATLSTGQSIFVTPGSYHYDNYTYEFTNKTPGVGIGYNVHPNLFLGAGRRKTAYALHQIVNAQPSMRRSESSPTSSRPSPVREDPPPEESGKVSSLSPRVIRMRRKSCLKKFISVDFCWLSEHI